MQVVNELISANSLGELLEESKEGCSDAGKGDSTSDDPLLAAASMMVFASMVLAMTSLALATFTAFTSTFTALTVFFAVLMKFASRSVSLGGLARSAKVTTTVSL